MIDASSFFIDFYRNLIFGETARIISTEMNICPEKKLPILQIFEETAGSPREQ